MEQLGLPGPLRHRAVAVALPYIEIVLGMAGLGAGGIAGRVIFGMQTLLYLSFLVLVARSVAQGDHVDCHCFGSADPEPVSRMTVVRNAGLVLLAALSLFISAHGSVLDRVRGFGAPDWAWTTGLILFCLVLLASSAIRHRERDARAIALARRDLAIQGQLLVPEIDLHARDGATLTLSSVLSSGPALFLRVSSSCGPCRGVVRLAPGWQERLRQTIAVVLLTTETHDEFFTDIADPGLPVYRVSLDALKELGLVVTPSGVLAGSNGKLASGAIIGSGMLRRFVDEVEALVRPRI